VQDEEELPSSQRHQRQLSSGKRWLVLLIQQSSLVRHCRYGNDAPATFVHLCSHQNQATLLPWLFPLLLIFDIIINEKWDDTDTPVSKSELYSEILSLLQPL
jgi:hypothetical protein